MLIAPDAGVLSALCDTLAKTDVDVVAPALVNVFSASSCMGCLIDTVIALEVSQTEHEGTLFRGNSMATKVLSVYGIMAGQQYLCEVLGGPIEYLFANESLGWELNEAKAPPGSNVDANVRNVLELTNMFFDSVVNSVSTSPTLLRQICRCLRTEVGQKFPDSEYISVGGFYFLRLICPALVSPDGFGIVDALNPACRRPLILVSKILQNLANGVLFGAKESYMLPLNTFLEHNFGRVRQFFDELASTETSVAEDIPDVPLDLRNVERVHLQLHQNIEQLAQHLAASSTQQALQRFLDVMAKLGTPAIIQREAEAAMKRKKKKK